MLLGVVAMTGYIGDVARVRVYDLPLVVNQRVGKFTITDEDRLDPDYLFTFLRWDQTRQHIEGLGYGSAQPNVSPKLIHQIAIPLPPLHEQKRIAHILGTLDDKIELNRRMNATLEAMARALFQSWFIDFDPVRRNAARNRSQPSPRPSPKGRGSMEASGHYRGGFEFSGLLETARALRKQQTSAEAIFWELARDRQLMGLKFRRQHQIGEYIADFYCHEHRLVVEFDGGIHEARQRKDHKRDAWMQAQGFKVMRFTNERLLEDPESVLSAIAQAIGPSLPSPTGRRAGDEGSVEDLDSSLPSPIGRRAGDEGSVEDLDRLFPSDFEDSELGEIPKGWEVGTLGQVLNSTSNGVSVEEMDDSAAYIGLEHMPRRSIALDQWGTAAEVESNKNSFKRGDILFGKLRPYFHKVGIAPVDGVCSTDILVLSPTSRNWFGFAFCHCISDKLIAHATALSNGAKMPRTKWPDLRDYKVILPPESIAEQLNETLRPLFDRIIANIHESRTLAALRDALLPKLLSGELGTMDVATLARSTT